MIIILAFTYKGTQLKKLKKKKNEPATLADYEMLRGGGQSGRDGKRSTN